MSEHEKCPHCGFVQSDECAVRELKPLRTVANDLRNQLAAVTAERDRLQQRVAELEGERQWITDHKGVDENREYVSFAINTNGKRFYLSNPEALRGWQFRQRMEGCYAAIPLPKWPQAKGGE